MSTLQSEVFYENRQEWLDIVGREEKDVMHDEKGEFIMVEPQLMDEGEPEDTRIKKIYLPDSIQLHD